MRASWLVVVPLLIGARDPFQVPEDRCRVAQLAQWRYGGAVAMAERRVGILQDSMGKWRRVQVGDLLPTGWRIGQLTADRLTISVGLECEPAHWVWRRGERENNAMDESAVTVSTAGGPGGEK